MKKSNLLLNFGFIYIISNSLFSSSLMAAPRDFHLSDEEEARPQVLEVMEPHLFKDIVTKLEDSDKGNLSLVSKTLRGRFNLRLSTDIFNRIVRGDISNLVRMVTSGNWRVADLDRFMGFLQTNFRNTVEERLSEEYERQRSRLENSIRTFEKMKGRPEEKKNLHDNLLLKINLDIPENSREKTLNLFNEIFSDEMIEEKITELRSNLLSIERETSNFMVKLDEALSEIPLSKWSLMFYSLGTLSTKDGNRSRGFLGLFSPSLEEKMTDATDNFKALMSTLKAYHARVKWDEVQERLIEDRIFM